MLRCVPARNTNRVRSKCSKKCWCQSSESGARLLVGFVVGELELAEKALNKKANVNIEGKILCDAEPKKKWTPLIWASCKGFLPIVKLLLQRGAHQQYTVVDPNNRLVIMGTNR